MKYLLPLLLLAGLAGCADYDDYAYQQPYPSYAYNYGSDYAPSYYPYTPGYYNGYSDCGSGWDASSCTSTFGGND